MTIQYIERSLEPILKRAVQNFPAVVLTGPRQSGKTTLLKHLFGESHRYVSMEPPDVRAAAVEDPRGLLEAYPPPVIFDEIQYAPDLLPYIKERIDAHRDRRGEYLLTGSQNLLLLEGITETLAGRVAILRLLPLSLREAHGVPQEPLPWERSEPGRKVKGPCFGDLWKSLVRGGYPELTAGPDLDIGLWHASYVHTYLERDMRSLRQVGDLNLFQSFIQSLAVRSGQLLNLTEVARDLGLAVNTAKAWLSVLEASYQVIILRPYFVNIGKRLVKTPKIYFTDTGTLCYLVGLKDPSHTASGPLAGPILETAIISEILKTYMHRGEDPRVYFWRTMAGTEVDLIVDSEGSLVPIEVKLSATPKPTMAKGIKIFQNDFGERAAAGYVIHPGDIRLPFGPKITAMPFADL